MSKGPPFTLSRVSRKNLEGVHPDLVRVVERAIKTTRQDFRVIEGRRSVDRQRALVARGASQTMMSRHLTGHAVDLAAWDAGKVSWHWPDYHVIAAAMKAAAKAEGVPLTWGGDWRNFPDGPHFELPRRQYPWYD